MIKSLHCSQTHIESLLVRVIVEVLLVNDTVSNMQYGTQVTSLRRIIIEGVIGVRVRCPKQWRRNRVVRVGRVPHGFLTVQDDHCFVPHENFDDFQAKTCTRKLCNTIRDRTSVFMNDGSAHCTFTGINVMLRFSPREDVHNCFTYLFVNYGHR